MDSANDDAVTADGNDMGGPIVGGTDGKEEEVGGETTPKGSGQDVTPVPCIELGKEITPPDGIIPLDGPSEDEEQWTSVQKKRKSVKSDSSKVIIHWPHP